MEVGLEGWSCESENSNSSKRLDILSRCLERLVITSLRWATSFWRRVNSLEGGMDGCSILGGMEWEKEQRGPK